VRYQKAVTAPKSTPATQPVSGRLKLTVGKITAAYVSFPAGCAGLVGARVLRGGHQLWPVMGAAWFVTDDFTIAIEEGYYLTDEPLDLVLEVYNTDTHYDHTVTLQLDLIEPFADPITLMGEIADRLAAGQGSGSGGLSASTQQALFDIRDLLFIIHGSDLPMIYEAILQTGRAY